MIDLSSLAWLAVIPALGLLILVHELGHFLVALKMGIKVEEFGIGYPPRMVTLFERNGIKYTLNWLPLGGFVRMTGEEGNFDAEGSLSAAPPWKKIPVIAAGVIMNMITAMVLFAIIFGIWGKEVPIRDQVFISLVQDGSAAQEAGLKEGDRIISVAGTVVHYRDEVSTLVQKHENRQIEIVIQRDDVDKRFFIKPRPLTDGGEPLLGVGVISKAETQVFNPIAALWEGIVHSVRVFVGMTLGFGMLLAGLLGLASAPEGSIAGPVGIARITSDAIRTGFADYLYLTALLSVNLALINILPIPALDGSRIVFALIEWVRRGRKVAPEKEAFIHAIGMILLLGLILLVTISDIGSAIRGEPVLPQ